MGKINKFQYGYKVPTRTWGDIRDFLNKGAEVTLKALEPIGKVMSSVVSNLPQGGASAVLPQQSFKNFQQAKQREKVFEEKVGPVLSPTNHAIAWTQGSMNPKIGQQKLAEWGPLAQLGSFVTDVVAFKYIPKVPGASTKAMRGVKKGIVANEFRRTVNKGIRTSPQKTSWSSYQDFRQNGFNGQQLIERSWLDKELETGDPNTMVHYDFGDHKSSFRKNNGAYIKNNKLIPGQSSKEQANYIWWSEKGPWQHSQWMFVNPELKTPTRYISTPKTKQFLRVNDHPEKTIGQNQVAPETIMDNEFVTENPVDLSNASIIQKDPLGWWGRVKYTKGASKQNRIISEGTYPWYRGKQHSINEVVNPDGSVMGIDLWGKNFFTNKYKRSNGQQGMVKHQVIDFQNLKSYYQQTLQDYNKRKIDTRQLAEEKVLDYLRSPKFINRIKQQGLKDAEQIAKEMHDNALITEGKFETPTFSTGTGGFTVGEYDNGFYHKTQFTGPSKKGFNPIYNIYPHLGLQDTFDTVIHEFGGHAATLGYIPNRYSIPKANQWYESTMKEWFPHYRQVYEHNAKLKPIRKPEHKDSKDPYISYLEEVDEYSSRARAENIGDGGREDFNTLYQYFTKESVDNLLKNVIGIGTPLYIGAKIKSNEKE